MADNIKDYKAPTWKVGDKLFAKDLNNLANTVAEVEALAYQNKADIEELAAAGIPTDEHIESLIATALSALTTKIEALESKNALLEARLKTLEEYH